MEVSEAKAIVVKSGAVRWLRLALQLQDWVVDIEWKRIDKADRTRPDSTVKGQFFADPLYHRAIIEIDNEAHESEEDILFSLRHELLHCVHSWNHTYRRQVAEVVENQVFNMLDESFSLGNEQFVWQMERMLDMGLGLTPKEMIRKAKRHDRLERKARGS